MPNYNGGNGMLIILTSSSSEKFFLNILRYPPGQDWGTPPPRKDLAPETMERTFESYHFSCVSKWVTHDVEIGLKNQRCRRSKKKKRLMRKKKFHVSILKVPGANLELSIDENIAFH